jgi:hypothetical protein
MPVHDVEMDPVGAGLIYRKDFLAGLGKVGREQGRGNEQRAHRLFPAAELPGEVTRQGGRGNAAKFARQKVPGGTLLAIPAGPTGNKIPVISKTSRRTNSGTQIAKWIWATDLGGRFGRRACVPPERA